MVTREQVLRAVAVLRERKGYPPTIREVAEEIGLTYDPTNQRLRHYERDGLVKRAPGIARSLRLTPEGEAMVSGASEGERAMT